MVVSVVVDVVITAVAVVQRIVSVSVSAAASKIMGLHEWVSPMVGYNPKVRTIAKVG